MTTTTTTTTRIHHHLHSDLAEAVFEHLFSDHTFHSFEAMTHVAFAILLVVVVSLVLAVAHKVVD